MSALAATPVTRLEAATRHLDDAAASLYDGVPPPPALLPERCGRLLLGRCASEGHMARLFANGEPELVFSAGAAYAGVRFTLGRDGSYEWYRYKDHHGEQRGEKETGRFELSPIAGPDFCVKFFDVQHHARNVREDSARGPGPLPDKRWPGGEAFCEQCNVRYEGEGRIRPVQNSCHEFAPCNHEAP